MGAILDEAGKARAYHLKLRGMAFADQLAKEMLDHAIAMEKHYGYLQERVVAERNSTADYEELFAAVEDTAKWFEKAEAGLGTFFISLFVPSLTLSRCQGSAAGMITPSKGKKGRSKKGKGNKAKKSKEKS